MPGPKPLLNLSTLVGTLDLRLIRTKLLRPNQSRYKKIEVGRVDVADGDDE